MLLGACACIPRVPESGFLDRSVVLDGVDYRYQVYVPRPTRSGAPLPLILALHGIGERGSDGMAQTDVGLGHAIRRHPERFPAIVVFPQVPADVAGFHGIGERIALAELDRAEAEFHTDPERVYLTGLSMGGNGAWNLAYRHPARFAAAIVVCGFIGEFAGPGSTSVHYAPIVTAPDPYAAVARRIARIPIRIFHGDADPVVPVDAARRMAAALQAAGADVQYTELAGVGHDAWDPAYDRADLFSWLFAQKRR